MADDVAELAELLDDVEVTAGPPAVRGPAVVGEVMASRVRIIRGKVVDDVGGLVAERGGVASLPGIEDVVRAAQRVSNCLCMGSSD